MATTRRKSKRAKQTEEYQELSGGEVNLSSQEWRAECILEERRLRGHLQYLIQWIGTDPTTGRDYSPTWEPASNANRPLREEWEQKKACDRAERDIEIPSIKQKKRRRAASSGSRKKRVIEESPEPDAEDPIVSTSQPELPERAEPAIIADVQSSPADSSAPALPVVDRRGSPIVQIAPPPNSFAATDYEVFSQLDQSQQSDHQSPTPAARAGGLRLSSSSPSYRSSGVVPDTQSTNGEQSFVLPTQHTEEGSQDTYIASSGTSGGTEEEANDSVSLSRHLGSHANVLTSLPGPH